MKPRIAAIRKSWSVPGFAKILLVSIFAAVTGLIAPTAWGGLSSVTKSFSPASITAGTTSTLTIIISNDPPPGNPAGIAFTDNYPANLVNAVSPNVVNGCGGTVTASPGGSSLSLSGGRISGNNFCTITVTVTSTVAGSYLNSTGTVTSTNAGSIGPATATLTVTATPPTVAKSFSPASIATSDTSTLIVTLTNPNSTTAITGMAFTDNYPSNVTNTGTPGLTNTCGGTAAAAANGASLALSGGAIPASGSCSLTVRVTSAVAGSYLNSTGTVTTTNVGSGTAATATLTVTSAAPDSFNAFETSTAASAVIGSIYTKLAGVAFNLDVVAISGGSKATGFNNNVKVELLANTGTAGSGYGADNCPVSSTVIQTLASAAISGGRSTVNFAAVANAYRDVRVRISYPTTSPTVTACSNDSFAIRPPAFTITSTSATNNGTEGAPTFKAGSDNFNLTASAVAGYGGTPLVNNTLAIGTPTAGTITGSFGAASIATGIAVGNTFTYSEVGNLGLNANAVYDESFTSVDQPGDCTDDFSNDLVGGRYGCKIGSLAVAQTTGSSGFGRFIPHHFDTEVNHACAPGEFTYSGQPFPLKVTARNLAGETTVNYADAFAKTVTLSDANGAAGAFNPATLPAGDFVSGVADKMVPPSVSFAFATKSAAPATLKVRGADTDAVTSADGAEGATLLRSGVLRLANAYGSELLGIRVPVRALYCHAVTAGNCTDWRTNTSDTCTIISSGAAALGNYQGTLADGNFTIATHWNAAQSRTNPIGIGSGVTPGIGVIAFDRPTCAPAPCPTGSVDMALTVPAWLQGGPGTPWPQNPTSRLRLGSPKAPYIYLRERY